jgi:hypothetical protein
LPSLETGPSCAIRPAAANKPHDTKATYFKFVLISCILQRELLNVDLLRPP